jgi:hypothetical protein
MRTGVPEIGTCAPAGVVVPSMPVTVVLPGGAAIVAADASSV